MLKRARLLVSSAFILATVAGCAVVGSTIIDPDAGKTEQPGLIYYLPRTELSVTITPIGIKRTRFVEKTNKNKAEGTSAEVVAELPDIAKYEIYHLDIDIKPAAVPDHRQGYVLHHNRNIMATDQLCAGVDGGLLVAVEATAADETGNIIVSLGRLAGRLLGASPFSAPNPPGATSRNLEKLTNHQLVVSIDPLQPEQLDALSYRIYQKYGLRYKLNLPGAEYLRADRAPSECPADSVCYRTQVPLTYHFSGEGFKCANGPAGSKSDGACRRGRLGGNYRHTKTESINVVNQALTGHVKVTRAFMVEKVTRLHFDKGVLKSIAIRKPSEALATAKLPLSVVDAVMTSALAAPGKFLSNISGLPPTDQLQLIKNAQENATAVAALEKELANLRNSDLLSGNSLGRVAANEDLFKIRCHGTFPTQ